MESFEEGNIRIYGDYHHKENLVANFGERVKGCNVHGAFSLNVQVILNLHLLVCFALLQCNAFYCSI